jgi:hypothetical protein
MFSCLEKPSMCNLYTISYFITFSISIFIRTSQGVVFTFFKALLRIKFQKGRTQMTKSFCTFFIAPLVSFVDIFFAFDDTIIFIFV